MKRRELQALCKRHGLAGGGTNDDLAAALTGYGGAEEQAVGAVPWKGCLKRPAAGGSSGGGSGAAKKVTFVFDGEDEPGLESVVTTNGRRRKSEVTRSPVVAKTKKTRKAGGDNPGADLGGVERRRTLAQAAVDSPDESDVGEAGTDAPVRRSSRKAVNFNGAEMVAAGVVTQMNSAMAVEEDENVGEAVGREQKTREQTSQVQHLGTTLRSGLVVVIRVPESKRSRRNSQEDEPAVNVAKLERSGRRTTRSTSVAAPIVVGKKKTKTKTQDLHSHGEQPAVPGLPVTAAPVVTRVLRSRAVQVIVEETHFASKLASARSNRRRHQHVASSVEEEESQEQQIAPSLRRSRRRRKHSLNNDTTFRK